MTWQRGSKEVLRLSPKQIGTPKGVRNAKSQHNFDAYLKYYLPLYSEYGTIALIVIEGSTVDGMEYPDLQVALEQLLAARAGLWEAHLVDPPEHMNISWAKMP